MNIRSSDRKVPLGIFGKPFGIKGFIYLNYYGDVKENIKNFDNLFLEDESLISIKETISKKDRLCVKLDKVESRDQAESYRDKEIYAYEKSFPSLPQGEFYWFQLEGLNVKNERGEILGYVDHLMPTGANDVLSLKPNQDSLDNKERLIPFMKEETIIKVNLEEKLIYVKWPSDY